MTSHKGRTAPFADQRDADVWAARPVPRPNDRSRSVINKLLDIADTAGVPIAVAVYGAPDDVSRPALVHVQGGPAMGHLSLDCARRLVDAAWPDSYAWTGLKRREPTETCPHTSIEFRLPDHDTMVTVICEPTWEQANQ